jgi:dipeptidyl aminopeptidase/acylaminoacyl peptidase
VDLYTTNQQGGDKQLLLENDGKTVFWMLSSDLTPLMRIRRGDEGMNVYQVAEGDDWRDLFTLSINTRFRIEEIAQDGSHAFVLSARGRDKAALVKVDLTTGAEEVLFQDPDEDILSILNLDPFDGVIDGVFTNINGSALHPLTEKAETLARLAEAKGDRVELSNMRWAGDARYITATLSPDGISYTYHLFDLETGAEQQLGEYSFRRAYKDRLVKTKEVWIPARDGMEIHALLLRPKGVTGPVPMVVGVHGGPATHAIWQYNHHRQFLVNRGYAFLSVNFRGSTGFGKAYQAAGFGEYGRAMQDDLVDAAKWAVAEGIADPEAMAIMGGSYGGYAAAMGMTRDAGVFKAGVVEHAVLDVAYQMRNNPFVWGLTPEYSERYFGDVKDENDLQLMQDLSPSSHVDRIEGHVLVVAGKQDRIVGFEQSEVFVKAAKDAGKEIEELIFEDEGHGIRRWQNRVRHARKVEDFLAQHLGGRSGGWDYIETAADLLD